MDCDEDSCSLFSICNFFSKKKKKKKKCIYVIINRSEK